MESLQTCRQNGILIGVSTSRCEQNSLKYISKLNPDILIASGGAVVKRGSEYIYTAEMSVEETQSMIATTRKILGEDCEISVDMIDTNYWNYKVDPRIADQNWGDSVYSDFVDFPEPALKFCAEIFEDEKAMELKEAFPNCDCARFSDGYWYKFTKAGVTKESAIQFMCASCGIALENVIAFGDDYADIGMLKLCGGVLLWEMRLMK